MKKHLAYLLIISLSSLFSVSAFAQQPVVKGKVINASKETVGAVSVIVKGTNTGTYTSDKGEFSIKIPKFPATLVFSSIGFEEMEVEVNTAFIGDVELKTKTALGQEVVVSATRVATRQLESPVTIERMSPSVIRETPAVTFYDAIGNLKGVDVMSSSLTFKTIGTRGFNGSGNLRLNQLIDGMDNQAPGLNFAVGNVIGLAELDVDNVELLPGASSALYGSGGMNGTLLINSKSPFKYQGLSFQTRIGAMHTDGRQRSVAPYYDFQFRYAKKISENLAFKIGAQLVQAQDWQANDETNYDLNATKSIAGDRNLPGYNGINVYGDQISANVKGILRGSVYQQTYAAVFPVVRAQLYSFFYAQAIAVAGTTAAQADAFANAQADARAPAAAAAEANTRTAGTIGGLFATNADSVVSRTGWKEKDIVDYNTYNVKLSGGIYYKLWHDGELSLSGHWGTGTTVYTGSDRYSLKGIKMGQYKLELKGKNYMLRGYTTQENSGDAYNATALTTLMNEAILQSAPNPNNPSAPSWYGTYASAFAGARQGLLPGQGNVPASEDLSHVLARRAADAGRPVVGSDQFKALFSQFSTTPIGKGGAKFLDKSNLYVIEGMYNFADKIKFAEVMIGGSWKQYELNSQGTIFVDTAGKINLNEYGGFIQVQKNLFDSKVKLTLAGRYDKHTNFEGKFTPRVTILVKLDKTQNLRLSYQTAYRFPSTQDQYINLFTGTATLIGGVQSFQDYYKFNSNPVYDSASINKLQRGQITPAQLQPYKFGAFKPETVNSYEIGYKALFNNKIQIDAYYSYAVYTDFLSRDVLIQNPGQTSQKVFSTIFNTTGSVKSQNAGIGIDWLLPKNFVFNGNVSLSEITDVAPGVVTFFNTAKWRYNIGIANNKICKNFSFNATYRWQSEVFYESTFQTGTIPAFGTIDAQVSYKIPQTKHILKLGANNLLNEYYQTGFANPSIGGLYYLSFGFNVY